MRAWWLGAIVAVVATQRAGAQSIAQRVGAVRDGTVALHFATRRGVCGDGRGSVWTTDRGRDMGRSFTCIEGPVRVRLGRADGQTVSIRTCIACRSARDASDVDLGEVAALEAARYLLGVARGDGGRNAGDAVAAAAFADADVTADLARIVPDEGATLEARKQALFWLSQSDSPTRELVDLDAAIKPSALREHYTFVLSQRRDDAAVTKLIDIARHDRDTRVRKQAMFWLGQSKDPKAIQFFRDILVR